VTSSTPSDGAGIRGHATVGLDSNVLIYVLDDDPAHGGMAGAVIDAIARGEAHGILSTLVLTEVCSGPARVGDLALVDRLADDLKSLENTRFVPVSAEVAIDAAVLRAPGLLSTADAIHLASARSAGATAFVTNDRRIKSTPQVEVLYLDELDLS
jgi:predicted nucleic acid-binding protein